MKIRSTHILLLCLTFAFVACMKVDDFNQPGAFESYIGHTNITFGVQGITSEKETPANFDFTYKEGGFVLSGLPQPPGMSIYDFFPEKGAMGFDYKNMLMSGLLDNDVIDSDFDLMDFSGFKGEVIDANNVRFTDFAKTSEGFEKLGFKVRGKATKSGPNIYGVIDIYISLYDFFWFLDGSGMDDRLLETLSFDGGSTNMKNTNSTGREEITFLRMEFTGQGVTSLF
ncbi:MAG: hypothetical protein R3A11_05645 [Bdellovibrionota bacterium]